MVKSRRLPSQKIHDLEVTSWVLGFKNRGDIRVIELPESVLTLECTGFVDGEARVSVYMNRNVKPSFSTSDALRHLTRLANQRVMAKVR